MCTIIETSKMSEALDLIAKCYKVLKDSDCKRVYSTIIFDIRKDYENRIVQKIQSVENHIGEVPIKLFLYIDIW